MEQFFRTYDWVLKLAPLAAVLVAIWQTLRKRRKAQWGKIKTSCVFTQNSERRDEGMVHTGPASLLVMAVNYGPGEVTIRALKGRYKDKSVHDITLGSTAKKLQQGDHLERVIIPMLPSGQYEGFYNKEQSALVDIWFEDTFGRKHKVKCAKTPLGVMRTMVYSLSNA